MRRRSVAAVAGAVVEGAVVAACEAAAAALVVEVPASLAAAREPV
jgi:hypothetical protein